MTEPLKKVSRLLLISAVAIFSPNLWAQSTLADTTGPIYNLNDFKFRFQRYRALEFDFHLNSNSDNYQNWNKNYDQLRNLSRYDLGGSIDQFKYENSENRQSEERLMASLAISGSKVNYFQELQENTTISPFQGDTSFLDKKHILSSSFYYKKLNRVYLKNNKFWTNNFVVRADIDYNCRISVINPDDPIARRKNPELSSSSIPIGILTQASIGLGKGRIENVSDAVTAQFILNDLKEMGVIENFTPHQLEALADGIVKARNARYIGDQRFRYIDQISLIDSVCRANKIITDETNQLVYFSTLYDNFLYTNYYRTTGSRMTHSIALDLNYNNPNMIYEKGESDFFVWRLYLKPGYRFEYTSAYQVSGKLEKNTSVDFELYFPMDRYKFIPEPMENNTSQESISYDLSLGGFYGYTYQPNSRTKIDFGGSIRTSLNQTEVKKTIYNRLGLNLSCNYFFSRSLSFNFSTNIWASYGIESGKIIEFKENSKVLNSYLNSGLTYALF